MRNEFILSDGWYALRVCLVCGGFVDMIGPPGSQWQHIRHLNLWMCKECSK